MPDRNTYNVHTKFHENLTQNLKWKGGGHIDNMVIRNYLFTFGKGSRQNLQAMQIRPQP